MTKRYFCTFYILIVFGTGVGMLYAQSYREQFGQYKQQEKQKFEQFRSEQQQAFDQMRREMNAKYANFIRNAWERQHATPETKPDPIQPQPPVIYQKPQQDTLDAHPAPKPIPIDEEIVRIPVPTPQPDPIVPIQGNDQTAGHMEIPFYGNHISIAVPEKTVTLKSTAPDAIADVWDQLSQSNYDNIVASSLKARSDYKLCDWAYYQLTEKIAQQLYGTGNTSTLIQAYILVQSGYQLRFGADKERLLILTACEQQIYNHLCYTIDGRRYYCFWAPPANKSISICQAKFDGEKAFELQIREEQHFPNTVSEKRTLTSSKGISTQTKINTHAIHFYNEYPTGYINNQFITRWALYANTPMEEHVKAQLYPQLEEALGNKPLWEKINLLLNWVQTAFTYEYDDTVWGTDRAFFAIETLYYPYCDCEDRSILFSRLVRDLLHTNVVLLYYPGHLATAVESEAAGDYVTVEGRRFVVCDPTYIGAPAGVTMPDMDNTTAVAIILD